MTHARFLQPGTARSKTRHVSMALAGLITFSFSACGYSMKNPDIKQNPHPTQRYDITLTVAGAPGPFDSISGSVDYQVSNGRCVPLTPISGATVVPQKNVPITLTRVADNVYKGVVYADLFQDEDYYGLGVCHWEVVAAGAELQVRSLIFSPSLYWADMKSGVAVPRYFSGHAYRNYHGDRLIDIGNEHREDFKLDAADVFSITMQAQVHQP